MARRMYDLDNGTENIKVKTLETENMVAGDEIIFSFNGSDKITFNINGAFFNGVPLFIPQYPTALRPATMSEGAIIYDCTLKKCILWNGTAWVNLDGTSLGA